MLRLLDDAGIAIDRENNAIRRVGPGAAGGVETLVGGGQPGSSDGSFLQARFDSPGGVALDSRGRLWVADSENHTIRLIDLIAGSVETLAGLAGSPGFRDGRGQEARFTSPTGLAIEPEPLAAQLGRARTGGPPPPLSVLVADRGNGALRRVREDGRVTTVGASDSVAARPSAPWRRPRSALTLRRRWWPIRWDGSTSASRGWIK